MPETKIKILPDFIANQIAAGEVVQRPESVVKELVENALDAGAKTIAVIVKEAGKQLIHIVDDGAGMSEEDLKLSVKRHATSKVFSAEDLEEIRSYGFRGEALASIASVAFLEIRTKTEEEGLGWKLISEPNKEPVIEPVNMSSGTQIFVKNLFYNVPARRKFLKANLTEFRHISDTMIKFALNRPDIRFTFYDDETLIFDVMPSGIVQRIKDILGDKTSGALIKVNHETKYVTVTGFVGEPSIAKQSKAGQYLFLNKRSINSKSLSHAVYSAFEHLLDKNNYPFYVLNLQIDPKNVDVNVHPQKHEVKFDDERYVYRIVNQAVLEALRDKALTPDFSIDNSIAVNPFEKSNPTGDNDFVLVNKATGEIIDRELPRESKSGGHDFVKGGDYNIPRNRDAGRFDSGRELSAFEELFGKEEGSVANKPVAQAPSDPHIMQVFNRYLVINTGIELLLMDQKKAHERVLYDKAMNSIEGKINNSQELLFPVTIKFNASEIAVLKDAGDYLEGIGYKFELKDDSLVLTGVPVGVKPGKEEETIRMITEDLHEHDYRNTDNPGEFVARAYAARCAVGNIKLNSQEIKSLYHDLRANGNRLSPDGKIALTVIKPDDLKKILSGK